MQRPSQIDDAAYVERLARLQGRWWKRLLDVQRPYRWYLRRLNLGFVLDVGCGIGRSLRNAGGHGVGVDTNAAAVAVCRAKGLDAYTDQEFLRSPWARPDRFDALLLSHVVEHMRFSEASELLLQYLPFVKPAGKVVIIAPQARGFASDPTHVEPFDFAKLARLFEGASIRLRYQCSFPLPTAFGAVFTHNESIVVGETPRAI
ncbi:MAG: class I SAM-dependent methyltransferase [Deltaproteobacteria bacterium]|nr:class I SAM-dependent methyltransferase [Deltaproteobacteria bacterium]